MRHPLYVLRSDDWRPPRLWALHVGDDGLVHWARHVRDSARTTLPRCFEESRVHLDLKAYTAVKPMPTCVRCIVAPMKPVAS